MVVRLLLVIVVALALGGVSATSVSADVANVVVELDGESVVDLDEAQLVVGEVAPASSASAGAPPPPDSTAPVPPFRHGVFRPPRVAFD